MIFAVFQGEVVVGKTTSIDFDPQISQITVKAIRIGDT